MIPGEYRSSDSGAPPPSRRRILLVAGAAILLALTSLIAGRLALSTRGWAFAELVVDPYACFSAVRLPSWDDAGELRLPDRLLSVDGEPLARDPARPNRFVLPAVHAMLERRRERGNESATLVFARAGAEIAVERRIGAIGVEEIAFLHGLYTLVGWAIFGSAIVVFMVAGRRAAARAYGLWALGAALFFFSFYDYHSTARLVPLFNVGAICTELGLLWLAWSFPEPPQRGAAASRRGLVVLSAAGAMVAVVLTVSPALATDMTPLRMAVSQASPLCMLALVGALAGRLRVSSGEARAQLRSTMHGLITVPLLIAIGFVLLFVTGSGAIHLMLPLLAPAAPFAVAYAIVRHDILHTRAVLPRRLVLAPLGFLGSAVGLVVWLVLRHVQRTNGMEWLNPAIVGVLTGMLLVIGGHRLFVRVFFKATEQYRPTIEQLGERLSVLRDEEAIRAELSRLVRRWLPVERVQVLPGEVVEQAGGLSDEERAALRLGKMVRSGGTLLLPMRFQGDVCGVFELGRKDGSALFTSEDMSLLDTMAALGAVALHHAAALQEVESLRRAQAKASREERSRVVDTLSAEIAHELGHPLRYFKALFEERGDASPLTEEEVELARLQVERMDRMRATLETMEIAPLGKVAVPLARPVEHALVLLREQLQASQIATKVDLPEGVSVQADHDALVQVMTNLLRNAAQAAGTGGHVGVRARSDGGGGLVVDVWDDGPGVTPEVQETLFRVWGVTTRREGKGVGLMVVNRILTHLHWQVDFLREDHLTVFRISIPSFDVVTP
ncbi:MAG: HAMP domain-containing sensor histidine kinase [Polyangiaceae bacterium]